MQVARLAKKLPKGDIEAISHSIGGGTADGVITLDFEKSKISTEDLDEDDLT